MKALSRGAREELFLENNPKGNDVCKDNLKFTKIRRQRRFTLTTDVMNALYKLEGEKVF